MKEQLDQIIRAVDSIRGSLNNSGKDCVLIHHSASPDHPAFNWGEIRRWHLAKAWRDVGYHYGVEDVDGGQEIIVGRFEHESGAHCPQGGMNRTAIGICAVGNFELAPPPPEQWKRCLDLVRHLTMRLQIPRGNVLGHREVPGTATACPGKFWDMDKFRGEL